MIRQILISATPQETRVAILDDARLSEIFIEHIRERGLAGSIFKGRVTQVLPGMQAAFVDIGLEKAAFLHARDLPPAPPAAAPTLLSVPLANGHAGDLADNGGVDAAGDESVTFPPIEDRLVRGQDVMLQIAKEPIGTKGPRVTGNIGLPGRYLVYMPETHHIGVSRRILDEGERERLREAAAEVSPEGGVILRTAAVGVSKAEIQVDLRILRRLWNRIQRRAESLPAPALLHSDLDVTLRTIRDLLGAEVSRVLVDNRRDYQRVVDFVETVMPRWRTHIELYGNPEPLFERYGVESQIARALDRKVWLKSGGHIVIDHTEALTAIDVNTGRFVGRSNAEETIVRTNLEAARTIVEQIRLRNIGGLIVIDFIDMQDAANRQAVLAELTDALRADKAATTILGISELGLVEMTRTRTRESLSERLCEPCPTCGGKGRVKAPATTAYEVLRRIRREASRNGPLSHVDLVIHPNVAAFLREKEPAALRELERELSLRIDLRESTQLLTDRYEIVCAVTDVRIVPDKTPIAAVPD